MYNQDADVWIIWKKTAAVAVHYAFCVCCHINNDNE